MEGGKSVLNSVGISTHGDVFDVCTGYHNWTKCANSQHYIGDSSRCFTKPLSNVRISFGQ